ncbi:AAA family ATPase [Rhizorhabdus sp.]|uniref:AAA family ATPase n=1 Tax=Rhizorhabdus sp. TaxID=1968843 RepID=UPI001986ADF0|nr:AAA family ATPase [Rhizorhabdus sp.]MBD3762520.1 AAA family ATPase [Rhizorhabdus sp.]
MQLRKLNIINFKGIKSAEVEICTTVPGNVITLIGLNESGKTTVLEALSHFVSVDADTSSIVNTVAPKQRPIDLIPKHRKSNFTGNIEIRASLELEDLDISDLEKHLRQNDNINLQTDTLSKKLSVHRVYKFKDSDLSGSSNLWWFDFKFTRKKNGVLHFADGGDKNRKEWDSAVNFLTSRFPKIVYFPTFLFSVPDKIYLEELPDGKQKEEDRIINRYFRQVLQDVADSLDDDVSIKRHIVDRIDRKRSEFPNPLTFFAALMGMDEYAQIRSVVNRLSGAITRTVFDAWNEIFHHGVSGKSVKIEWGVDSQQGNIPYLQLSIFDGEHDYAVHERSLGFRWFFTFLLFTQFRRNRSNERGTIFLFDEPASNLHARAQMKLLESFGRTAQNNQYIIYSTHSHYMIDPLCLEKAYIVENKGIDFEGEEAGARFDSKPTDIRLARYRQFVASHPDRISYFQPALDALRFSFGPLVPGQYAIIVEGKFDFHPITYFKNRLSILKDVTIFPAPSASEAGTLISLMRGLGTTFVVMLDDDNAGRTAAKRYKSDHLLSDEQLFTIAKFDQNLKGKAFEGIYSSEVAKLASPNGAPSKGQYSLLFQRLFIEKNNNVDLGETTSRVKNMLQGLNDILKLG